MNYDTDTDTTTGLIPLLPLDMNNNNLKEDDHCYEDDDDCILLDYECDYDDEDEDKVFDNPPLPLSYRNEEEDDNPPLPLESATNDCCDSIADLRKFIGTVSGLDTELQTFYMSKMKASLDLIATNIASDVESYFSLFSDHGILSDTSTKRFFSIEDQKHKDFSLRLCGPLTVPPDYKNIPIVSKLEEVIYKFRGANLVDRVPYEIWDIIFSMTGYTKHPNLYNNLRRTCKRFNASCQNRNTRRRIYRPVSMSFDEIKRYGQLSSELNFLSAAREWAFDLVDGMTDNIKTLEINLNTISAFMIGAGVDKFKPDDVKEPYHMRNCTKVIFEEMLKVLKDKKSVKKLVLTRVPSKVKGLPNFNTALLADVFRVLSKESDKTSIHILDVSRLEVKDCPLCLLKLLPKMRNMDTLVCDRIGLDGSTFRGTVNIKYLIANTVYFNHITHVFGTSGINKSVFKNEYRRIVRRKNLNILCGVLRGTGCHSCLPESKTQDFKTHNRISGFYRRNVLRVFNPCCIDNLFHNMKWGIENLLVARRYLNPKIPIEYYTKGQTYCFNTMMLNKSQDHVMQLFIRPSMEELKKQLDYEIIKVPEEHSMKRQNITYRAERLRKKLKRLEKTNGKAEEDAFMKIMEEEIKSLKQKRANAILSSIDSESPEFQFGNSLDMKKDNKRKRSTSSDSDSLESPSEEEEEPKMVEKKKYKDPLGQLPRALKREPLDLFEKETKEEWFPHICEINSSLITGLQKFDELTRKEHPKGEGPMSGLRNPFSLFQ